MTLMSCHQRMRVVCLFVLFLAIQALVCIQLVHAPVAYASGTSQFRGVNWANPRDNYADDPVVPSGLSTSDSHDTISAKAKAILKGFATNLGANTVRLPINQYTVNGPFWNS